MSLNITRWLTKSTYLFQFKKRMLEKLETSAAEYITIILLCRSSLQIATKSDPNKKENGAQNSAPFYFFQYLFWN